MYQNFLTVVFSIFPHMAFVSPLFGNSIPLFLWECTSHFLTLCSKDEADHPYLEVDMWPRAGQWEFTWPRYCDQLGEGQIFQVILWRVLPGSFARTTGIPLLVTVITKLEGYNFEAILAILTLHEKVESKDAERFLVSVEHLDPVNAYNILDFLVIWANKFYFA